MIASIRQQYNRLFSSQKYRSFLQSLHTGYDDQIPFRVAETPVFVPAALKEKLVAACESIIDVILQPHFKTLTEKAIPSHWRVPRENACSHFITIDFAVCKNEKGTLIPQLIELQGFPTLFFFQELLDRKYREYFPVPEKLSSYLNGYTADSYIALLKKIILGRHDPENVILLEIKPQEQKTRIDFHCTQDKLGIRPVCLTELVQEGRQLFYYRDGEKTLVKRVYNRLIFDELESQRSQLGKIINLTEDLAVEWVPHPNWFYRISKFTLPFLKHDYVPPTFFLNELPVIPQDLGNYVLKPLFSFAGQGVVIDVTREQIDKIKDPENWILQQKVQYTPAIQTPSHPAKCEIRMIYCWDEDQPRPVLVHNLARLSKGKMIGVRYNANQDWVGGSLAYFEK